MKRGGRVVLLFIFSCHAVSFLVFCKGFMLKRVVVPEFSYCAHPHNTSNRQTCNLFPRPFKRVVWLLIDALRYDFTVYDETAKPPLPSYRNKMPYIRDLLRMQPANARLFKFVADPPTTTMQRLKALTTGSLPTFIDIGSNFNSYAISEDSLPLQAKLNDRNITFIGDDTWLGLYPGMLSKTFDYPSLNVQDLDTVDEGVREMLGPELAKGDAEMVIGHMLGVDHVGHTYGPSHRTMAEKLTQMNDFIQHVFTDLLDEGTVVFVFGDHGMSPTGDHGGETDMETGAALLIYSPRPLFNPSEPASGREVYQVDLVPTTALALGMPIPFSNLGMLIPEVLLPFGGEGRGGKYDGSDGSSDRNAELPGDGFSGRVTLEFLQALRINADQIHNYLATYARYSQDFPVKTFNELDGAFSSAVRAHQNLLMSSGGEGKSQREMTRVAKSYFSYMREVKVMCQSIWAKFDVLPMVLGLGLMALTVLIVPLMLLDVRESSVSLSNSIPVGTVAGLVAAAVLALCSGFELSLFGLVAFVGNFVMVSLAATIFVFVWNFRASVGRSVRAFRVNLFHTLYQVSLERSLSVAVVLLHAVSMFSNSFILYEADMLAFFIQSFVCALAVRTVQKELSSRRLSSKEVSFTALFGSVLPHVVLMACVRLSKLFYACRDLQIQDGCEPTTFILPLGSASELLGPSLTKLRAPISTLAHYCVGAVLLVYLRKSKHYRTLNPYLARGCEICFPVCVLLLIAHWQLQYSASLSIHLPGWLHVAPPRVVYAVSTALIALCVARPFRRSPPPSLSTCESLLPNAHETAGPSGACITNETSQQELNQTTSRALVVMVTAIVLGALWSPAVMVLNDGIAISAALSAVEMLLALRILQNSGKGVSWEACVLWSLLGAHSFFSLGHHATVTSLRFEAGFVGIHGEITKYNLPLAAVLVGFNTIASQVFFGLGFPLLLVLGGRKNERDHIFSLSEQLLPPMIMYIGLHSIKLLVTMVTACLHRRHLMVWWVFAPRFLYEGAFQVTADVAMILAATFVSRLEHMLAPPRRLASPS